MSAAISSIRTLACARMMISCRNICWLSLYCHLLRQENSLQQKIGGEFRGVLKAGTDYPLCLIQTELALANRSRLQPHESFERCLCWTKQNGYSPHRHVKHCRLWWQQLQLLLWGTHRPHRRWQERPETSGHAAVLCRGSFCRKVHWSPHLAMFQKIRASKLWHQHRRGPTYMRSAAWVLTPLCS